MCLSEFACVSWDQYYSALATTRPRSGLVRIAFGWGAGQASIALPRLALTPESAPQTPGQGGTDRAGPGDPSWHSTTDQAIQAVSAAAAWIKPIMPFWMSVLKYCCENVSESSKNVETRSYGFKTYWISGMFVSSICMGMLVSSFCIGKLVSSICMGKLVSSICMGKLVSSICMGKFIIKTYRISSHFGWNWFKMVWYFQSCWYVLFHIVSKHIGILNVLDKKPERFQSDYLVFWCLVNDIRIHSLTSIYHSNPSKPII